MERDDADIVRSVLAGNADDFALLKEKYYIEAQRWAFRYVRDIVEAEEVAQAALVEAYCKLGTLREPEKFGGWLRGIVGHIALSWLRRRKKTVVVEEFSAMAADGRWSSYYSHYRVPAPDQQLEDRERKDKLDSAIRLLPSHYQEVIRQFYFEDQSQRDIAVLLGISVAAVKSLLSRARGILREELSKDERDTG